MLLILPGEICMSIYVSERLQLFSRLTYDDASLTDGASLFQVSLWYNYKNVQNDMVLHIKLK